MRAVYNVVCHVFATALLVGVADRQNTPTVPAGKPVKGLQFATAPSEVRQIALDFVPSKVSSPGVANIQMEVSPPLTMYCVRDIGPLLANGNLEAEAKLASYDYFIKSSGKLNRIVDVDIDSTGKPIRPASVDTTPRPNISDGLDQIATLLQVKMGSYEARSLNFNFHGRGLSLLWLKSAPGGTDLIYPVLDWPEQYQEIGVQKGMLYTWPNFLARLQVASKSPHPPIH